MTTRTPTLIEASQRIASLFEEDQPRRRLLRIARKENPTRDANHCLGPGAWTATPFVQGVMGASQVKLDQLAFRAAQAKETARMVNALVLRGYVWPDERPRTPQKLYDAMCRLRGITPDRRLDHEGHWNALRRWMADLECKAAMRQPAPFTPYVRPPAMRIALARCAEIKNRNSIG